MASLTSNEKEYNRIDLCCFSDSNDRDSSLTKLTAASEPGTIIDHFGITN